MNQERFKALECSKKIVECYREMVVAEAQLDGFLRMLGDIIESRLGKFEDYAIETPKGHVVWRLANAYARPNSCIPSIDYGVVFLANPEDVVRGAALTRKAIPTRKEKELVSQLQELWDKNKSKIWFRDWKEFRKISDELSSLTHKLKCCKWMSWRFTFEDISELRDAENFLSFRLDFTDLEEGSYLTERDLRKWNC